MMERAHVMMGSLSNFALADVLDVVGLSRQHTLVELRDSDGSSVASLNLKGGHLVQSASEEFDPREALRRALQAPARCTFHVFRLQDNGSYRSFGELGELLAGGLSAPAHQMAAPPPAPSQIPRVVSMPPKAPAPHPMTPQPPAPQPPASAKAPAAPATAAGKSGISLAVASPKGGVGKTTIALNLAISLAHQGFRVVLIDADINGDLLSLINARSSADIGTYDLLRDSRSLEPALRRTVVNGLRVLPAAGPQLPALAFIAVDRTVRWQELIREATTLADIVLVDCPAGMANVTLEIMQAVTHVLGVFQAEAVASRSFEMFERGLAALGDRARPEVAGVVVNMLREDATSRRAYDALVSGDTSQRVVKTVIGRSDVFEAAAGTGVPVRFHNSEPSRRVAAVFDNLASEIATRVRLIHPQVEAGGFLM